ncbi:MAG: hypothetical protein CL886_00745 [Dehalococcoidia bacterium]|nr:hypothetical protein [Dehalococcoidia bacterium]
MQLSYVYTSEELSTIRSTISHLPTMSKSDAHAMNLKVSTGACPSHLGPFHKLNDSHPDLYRKLVIDAFVVKYGAYGFFPKAYDLIYLSDESPNITFSGRTRGRVAILTSSSYNMVIKPLQNSKEAEIATRAGKLEVGPNQFDSLPGFLSEEYVSGKFITDNSANHDIMPQPVDIGIKVGSALSKLHENQICYNDTTLSDPEKRSHLIINQAGNIKLIDFGLSLSLNEYPNFSIEETFNYVRTMPIYRIFSAMNPTREDVHSFLKSYQRTFKEISPDTIYDRDIQFLTEGLQLMGDVLTEPDKTDFMKGFYEAYKR